MSTSQWSDDVKLKKKTTVNVSLLKKMAVIQNLNSLQKHNTSQMKVVESFEKRSP